MPYKNKEDQKLAAKKHYQNNKSVYVERAKLHSKKNKDLISNYVRDYLLLHSCVDCGEPDPVVLEFDHVRDDKLFNIADAKGRGYSLDTVKEEINKCDVRCANCHRRMTHKRRNMPSLLGNNSYAG